MKKTICLLLAIAIKSALSFAQTTNIVKTVKKDTTSDTNFEKFSTDEFIFKFTMPVKPCDQFGNVTANASVETAFKGNQFHISSITPSGNFVIQFNNFLDSKRRNLNGKYYLIEKDTYPMGKYWADNMDDPKFTVNFGTLVTPFKFRPTKSLFTSNLNLGSMANFQLETGRGWSVGALLGISLSQVTLDSLSTNYKVKTTTDRPALTPSFSFMTSNGKVDFTLGFGIDYINRTSIIEQSWIFNGKPWIGFGIGISLFSNNNSTAKKTTASGDQTAKAIAPTP